MFEAGGSDAVTFGRSLHKVFEQVEWVDDTTLAKLEPLRETMPEAVDGVARSGRMVARRAMAYSSEISWSRGMETPPGPARRARRPMFSTAREPMGSLQM